MIIAMAMAENPPMIISNPPIKSDANITTKIPIGNAIAISARTITMRTLTSNFS